MSASTLCLNTITLRHAPTLAQRLRLAAEAGYQGVELWFHEVAPQELGAADRREAARRYGVDFERLSGPGDSAAALARRHGLQIAGLCPPSSAAVRWTQSLAATRAPLRRTFALAAELGAAYVVLPVLQDAPLASLAAHLGELAALAGEHGVRAGLEPVGHVGTHNRIEHGLAILERSGAGRHAGLVVDAFHFFRAGQELADLRGLDAAQIVAVHLNDALDLPREQLLGHRHRAYPGHGIWDVAGFCRALLASGFDGPFVTEILNEAYWRDDPREVCETAYRSSRDTLRAAAAEPCDG